MRSPWLVLIAALLCACPEQRTNRDSGSGGADAAGPSALLGACRAAIGRMGEVSPSRLAPIVRSSCAPLLPGLECQRAMAGLDESPQADQVVAAVSACTSAACPSLGPSRPPLCQATLSPDALDRSFPNEFARMAGAAMARSGTAPLSLARTIALDMTFDWIPLTGPDGPEPTRQLSADLGPGPTAGTSVLVLHGEDGATLGRWTFSGDEARPDVEEALDSVESAVRGAVVRLAVQPGAHGRTLARVRLGLLLLGARPL